jgi:hypothetical protein
LILFSPDELGIPDLQVGYLPVEDETDITFAFDLELMRRLQLAAFKRNTTPARLLAKAVVRAMENPAILSEIEMRHVRGR